MLSRAIPLPKMLLFLEKYFFLNYGCYRASILKQTKVLLRFVIDVIG